MPRLGLKDNPPVPWGSHLCTFYRSARDLQQLVSAYISAGLEDQECCVWVLPPTLTPSAAVIELQRDIPSLDCYLESGQLELIPWYEWYLSNGTIQIERLLTAWKNKVNQGAARFVGLRVTGDTSWLQSKEQRDQFLGYEQAIRDAATDINLIALCTYPAAAWTSDDMLEVMQSHRALLLAGSTGWKTVECCT
jgi:MEDS: MEthanogen/methylotroph, DcmR Sensory domain